MGSAFKLRNGSLLITTEAPGGIYNSEQLKRIAALADEDSAIVKVTEDQRLALFVGEDKADSIVAELKEIGLGVRHYQDGLHQPTTCIGELCPDYQQDALGSALNITEEMSRLSVDNPLKIGINGCAQCCVPCHTLDISIVGDEQGYRISMGGKNSQIPEMATFMAEGVPESELPAMIHNIVQLYKDSAGEGESLQDVMDRVGVSKFADVLAPYSQDAAGGDDLFGADGSFGQAPPQVTATDEDAEVDPLGQEGLEDDLSLDDEEETSLVSEGADGDDFSDLEEVDDFDHGLLDEQGEETAGSVEEVNDQFIDEDLESDFVDSDELELEEELDEGDKPDLDNVQELELEEDDDFSDVDEQELNSDLDVEERLAAAESEAGHLDQELESEQLDSLDDDLEFSDFDSSGEDLEIGDEELDQSNVDGLKVIEPVSEIESVEDDVVIGTSDREVLEGGAEAGEDSDPIEQELSEEDDFDLSEISDEDLADFEEELDDDIEVSENADETPPPDLEDDLLESADLEENDTLLYETSESELEEMDAKEADEVEKRINEDIKDSQMIHEPDSNERDRNAILRKVEEGDSSHLEEPESEQQVSSVSNIEKGKPRVSQFQFEGFDVKENGDFVISFTSGAQFQFNYDLIKDGPRKIKLGSQSICIGLDSAMIFVEFEDGLKMNLPLVAA